MEWASGDNPAEWAVDVAAAAVFAGAVAFACSAIAADLGPVAAASAAPAFLLAFAALRSRPGDERRYALPSFEPAPMEFAAAAPASDAELLLDDPLDRVDRDSRVIRLFDPSRMPAGGDRSRPQYADASANLSAALAELRRSLS